MLATIADRHLRPDRHAERCAGQCAPGCPVREYEAWLASPVLASQIAEEKAQEERLRAFADQMNALSRGE